MYKISGKPSTKPVDADMEGPNAPKCRVDEEGITPPSMTISVNGETKVITFDNLDPSSALAADFNAVLREKGYDASMVHAMTPLHMLEDAERRMASAEERCKKAQVREQAWVDWFEALRMRYDGVIGRENLRTGQDLTIRHWRDDVPGKTAALESSPRSVGYLWMGLEGSDPWPSLEDERAEAIMDE